MSDQVVANTMYLAEKRSFSQLVIAGSDLSRCILLECEVLNCLRLLLA